MNIYFLRHGLAERRSEWKTDDFDRPLTAEGIDITARTATTLARMDLQVDAIITSPLVRARQTAQLIAQGLRMSDRLHEDRRLVPGFDTKQMGKILRDYDGAQAIMLVGHEPDFSTTISEMIGGGDIVMKKGALALVKLNNDKDTRGSLVWIVPPKVLSLPPLAVPAGAEEDVTEEMTSIPNSD